MGSKTLSIENFVFIMYDTSSTIILIAILFLSLPSRKACGQYLFVLLLSTTTSETPRPLFVSLNSISLNRDSTSETHYYLSLHRHNLCFRHTEWHR